MTTSIELVLWNVISKKSCLIFGQECASAAVWTMVTLALRCLVYFIGLENYLPKGLIFAFPILIQLVGKVVPVVREKYPVLPVRITESLIGRMSLQKILVVIPAHMLGGIVGIIWFRMLLPFVPSQVLSPLYHASPSSMWVGSFLLETFVNFLYITAIVVLPYVFEVNKVNEKWLSIAIVPLLLVTYGMDTCCFNPAIVYGLWYVNANSIFYRNFHTLQISSCLSPLLASILSALFCNAYFPDDAESWTRERKPKSNQL